MPHTDNSAVIDLLSSELEKLRPMEAALEIAEADNKKYIERIKKLEAENEKLKDAQRWRKFIDEKPDDKQWIFVYVENPSKYRTYIELRRWDAGCTFDVENQELYTKWMPQPKAPEE